MSRTNVVDHVHRGRALDSSNVMTTSSRAVDELPFDENSVLGRDKYVVETALRTN